MNKVKALQDKLDYDASQLELKKLRVSPRPCRG
jgi:hypothetical protein